MPFKYHPPTGRACKICEHLATQDTAPPIIDSQNGKASSANNFPFHNWYNFVLGYTPEFPKYMLERENINNCDLVIDPFMGSGTTQVVCKAQGIPSQGIDANDFMVDAASTKLNWEVDLNLLKTYRDQLLCDIEVLFNEYRWDSDLEIQPNLFSFRPTQTLAKDYTELLAVRPPMLLEKYLSDRPFARAVLIDQAINQRVDEHDLRRLFDLALTSVIVPISNIKYGPGFGVVKPKQDVDVLDIFARKLNRMIADLENTTLEQRKTTAEVHLGDSRVMTQYFEPNSASLMITSPPYPGDHEYTKHTRLELLFRGYASNHKEFQTIKRRMIRASTTNLYHEDNDRAAIKDIESINTVTQLIQERLDEDGATSGFEKLYTKLVWEYFGGMYKALEQCFQVLKPGAKIALLVSDSHSFKMVHIETAAILSEIGLRVGYINPEVILWQTKSSTSHRYSLRENILILQKPI